MKTPRCRAHPRYKGIYRPRTKKPCPDCHAVYQISRVPPLSQFVAEGAQFIADANAELAHYQKRAPVGFPRVRALIEDSIQSLQQALVLAIDLETALTTTSNNGVHRTL